MVNNACFDELAKLGAVHEDEALRAFQHAQKLEEDRPTPGQIARYSALGAIAGPTISALGDLAGGIRPFQVMKGGPGVLKQLASSAVKGALTSGAIPIVRHEFDRRAELGTLKQYMAEHAPVPDDGVKSAGMGPGAPMTVSDYSGPLSYGPFKLVSGLPNLPPPPLHAAVEKKAAVPFNSGAMYNELMAFFANDPVLAKLHAGLKIKKAEQYVPPGSLVPQGDTPAQRFSEARDVGTSAHNQPPGPSVHEVVGRTKPPVFRGPGMPRLGGWGKVLPGARQATEGLARLAVR